MPRANTGNAGRLKSWFDLELSLPAPQGAREDAREMAASELIPYTYHYDDHTVITKDEGLVQVVKIDGLLFDSLTAEQIKLFERRRNTVLRTIANSERGVYVHLVRRQCQTYPEGEGQTWLAKTFNAAWRDRSERKAFFVNDIYISIVRNRFRQGVPGVFDRALAFLAPSAGDAKAESFADQAKDIDEAARLLAQALGEYGARRLQIQRHSVFEAGEVSRDAAKREFARFGADWKQFQSEHGEEDFYAADSVRNALGPEYSEVAGFLHYLVNLEDERVALTAQSLDAALAKSSLDFNLVGNMMAVHNLSGTRAAAVLSMAEWPSQTRPSMLDEFLQLPVEFIITQSYFFTDRISAEHEMRQEHRRITVNDTQGVHDEDRADIAKGLHDLTSGRSVNGLHHLSMLVHVPADTGGATHTEHKTNTVKRLDAATALLKKAFVNLNVKPVREWLALETFYWAQLPGQSQHFMGRRGKINSCNFAGFASLHNYATGKIDGNLWGPAIMPFETRSGTAYHFNFHREIEGMVAGHTAIVADTGAGKTALLSALITMADKAAPRVFWFDHRQGATVFMTAMEGQHTTLTAHGESGWNPCALPDTADNRAYLVDLLCLMRGCYGARVSTDDLARFQAAVEENYELPPADRRLRNIAWCFGEGELARDMRVWHGAGGMAGAHAGVFDNEADCIDLRQCRHYCFEMGQLIKDGAARPELAVVLSYPFHRIEQAMDGRPFIIVLEEGQNLVKHAFWREKIDSYLMQIRRKNGLLVFVAPDVKYLYCETDSILKQTATKIFLPNGQAQRADYVDKLGLTGAEFEFIRDTPPEQRAFLIRRGKESIRATFDLADLPEFIPVFSSNDKGVALMHAVIAELGTRDPSRWVPEFMRRALAANTHNLGSSARRNIPNAAETRTPERSPARAFAWERHSGGYVGIHPGDTP